MSAQNLRQLICIMGLGTVHHLGCSVDSEPVKRSPAAQGGEAGFAGGADVSQGGDGSFAAGGTGMGGLSGSAGGSSAGAGGAEGNVPPTSCPEGAVDGCFKVILPYPKAAAGPQLDRPIPVSDLSASGTKVKFRIWVHTPPDAGYSVKIYGMDSSAVGSEWKGGKDYEYGSADLPNRAWTTLEFDVAGAGFAKPQEIKQVGLQFWTNPSEGEPAVIFVDSLTIEGNTSLVDEFSDVESNVSTYDAGVAGFRYEWVPANE
jgi:hypothetical protein